MGDKLSPERPLILSRHPISSFWPLLGSPWPRVFKGCCPVFVFQVKNDELGLNVKIDTILRKVSVRPGVVVDEVTNMIFGESHLPTYQTPISGQTMSSNLHCINAHAKSAWKSNTTHSTQCFLMNESVAISHSKIHAIAMHLKPVGRGSSCS